MINRVPKSNEVSIHDFLIEIKRIDNSWQLFCKNHPTIKFKKDYWRNFILSKDKEDKFKKVLCW